MDERIAEELSFLVNSRGYLVIGSILQYPVGHVIRSFWHDDDVDQPITVIAVTGSDDYMQQAKLMGEKYGDNHAASPDDYPYYYRCIAD